MLLGIRIQNFCIFKDDKAGILLTDLVSGFKLSRLSQSAGVNPSVPFTNLMALIGRNASGKSLFFDALSFVHDVVKRGCVHASTRHRRPGFLGLCADQKAPISFELLFLLPGDECRLSQELLLCGRENNYYASYHFEIAADHHGQPFFFKERVQIYDEHSTEQKLIPYLDLENGHGKIWAGNEFVTAGVFDRQIAALRSYGALFSHPLLGALYEEIKSWFFGDFSSAVGNFAEPVNTAEEHRHLNRDGSNVANVLAYLEKEDKKKYHGTIEQILEKIPRIKKKAQHLPEYLRKSPDKLFLYLLLLADPRPPALLCLETPDMGLYHDMVDILARQLREYALHHPFSQVIFTTHNPYILESLSPAEVWIFKREDDLSAPAEIHSALENPLVQELYSQGVGMGALWYAGHFDE